MSSRTEETPRLAPPPTSAVLMLLVASLFIAMGWIRSQQGTENAAVPSRIEQLAKGPQDLGGLSEAQFRGRQIFQHYCQICHGVEGKGDGMNSFLLEPTPRDFTSPDFWAATTRERVWYAVSQGGRSVGKSQFMPPWGRVLSKDEIQGVIDYIETFKHNKSAAETSQSDPQEISP